MRQVNQRLLKISHLKSDWIPIDTSLELDQEVTLIVHGQVTKISQESTNGEEVDEVVSVKGLWAEVQE